MVVGEQARSASILALGLAIFVVLAAAGIGLSVEYGLKSCPVPGTQGQDSGPVGVVQRRWLPPGTSCRRTSGNPNGTPREWDAPESWRYSVAAIGLILGVALVVLARRDERAFERR